MLPFCSCQNGDYPKQHYSSISEPDDIKLAVLERRRKINFANEIRLALLSVAHVKPPRGCYMARATGKKFRQWTKEDHRTLKAHSKAKTPVVKISKEMKRTVGALRQQARRPLGALWRIDLHAPS
jgi:hypothetical protein